MAAPLRLNGRAVAAAAPAGGDDADLTMTDLAAEHAPLAAALEAAAARVLRSGRFILGDEVAAFEREVAATVGVPHAVGVSSGTDALLALLMAAGVGAGDEVVTTPYSFFATAEAIVRVGARPVFADVEAESWNLDPAAAVARLGPRTRAVVVVHLFGRLARTRPLEAACAAAGVPIFEDAAQAIGATDDQGRGAGAVGAGAALSFFPSKNLGGFGDGGMVLSRDPATAARIRRLRAHGADGKNHHVAIGGNFRLDELQAALLRVKLPHVGRWTAARRRVAAAYRAALADTPLALPPEDAGAVWNQLVVGVPDGRRDALGAYLASAGIATAVYYPEPLHLQPALRALGHRQGEFPVAERACRETLALPMHAGLAPAQVARVAEAVRRFFRSGA